MIDRAPFSYLSDSAVPRFDDAAPIFVFDGTCVLCSGGAAWLMQRRRAAAVRFLSAQSPLGEALYRHYGLALDESYLLLDGGRLFVKTDGYLRLCALMGGPWRLLRAGAAVPRGWRDRAYGLVAANRYRWFGQTGECALLTRDQRARLLVPAPGPRA